MTTDITTTTNQILGKLQEEFATRIQQNEVREIVQHLVPLAAADIVRQMRGDFDLTELSNQNNSISSGLRNKNLTLCDAMDFYEITRKSINRTFDKCMDAIPEDMILSAHKRSRGRHGKPTEIQFTYEGYILALQILEPRPKLMYKRVAVMRFTSMCTAFVTKMVAASTRLVENMVRERDQLTQERNQLMVERDTVSTENLTRSYPAFNHVCETLLEKVAFNLSAREVHRVNSCIYRLMHRHNFNIVRIPRPNLRPQKCFPNRAEMLRAHAFILNNRDRFM